MLFAVVGLVDISHTKQLKEIQKYVENLSDLDFLMKQAKCDIFLKSETKLKIHTNK